MSATMTAWRPGFAMTDPFRREVADLMDRLFGDEAEEYRAVKAWAPRVDVEETDKEFLVKADLPGVDPKHVEVAVEHGVLIVRGERKEEKEERKTNFHRVERFAGSFYRAVPLPAGVDPERMTASSTNGVVTVVIPKKPEAVPRKVVVTPKS